MKKVMALVGVSLFTLMTFHSFAGDNDGAKGQMAHDRTMHSMNDGRVSLGLSPERKRHQLSEMRSHLEAVQSIVGLLSEGAFDRASQIAYSELGSTDESTRMCNTFDNEGFRSLGLAFHESGDRLGDALQAKDANQSLRALQVTMGYCVQCHAAFRQ